MDRIREGAAILMMFLGGVAVGQDRWLVASVILGVGVLLARGLPEES